MNNRNSQKVTFFAVIAVVIVVALVIVGIATGGKKSNSKDSDNKDVASVDDVTLDDLYNNLPVNLTKDVSLKKGSINLSDSSLYDELPEIDKYPTVVDGTGQVDIEIFTSGEKAGKDNDSWLIECAENFNKSGVQTSSGKTVSMTIRSVSSGLAADYIISGKYLPDLYTPSNTLFGDYAIAQGGKLELYTERLVGNTAGILIKKSDSYTNIDGVVDAVMSGKYNIGYTNPQTSATGLNLLIEILNDYGGITSDDSAKAFAKFNNNIPFVAYTTQQMASSASSGTLDGMVTEYQAYINDNNLKSAYTFIPFGMRHDNPLYVVNKGSKSADELDAIKLISDYLTGSDCQSIATKDGFNANDDYTSSYTVSGTEVSQALEVYKNNKDSGKDIIAVFVADCSGSMSGDAINQLKESLSNGMQYINSNNYVGLISYGQGVTIDLPIAQFDLNQKAYFKGAVDSLDANGATPTYEALTVAMKMISDEQANNPDAKCMIFLLSDGAANGDYNLDTISSVLKKSQIPVYTIAYTSQADKKQMEEISAVNEAATINADSDDVIYKIKSLFNSQL